jgi:hypothetical protein
MFNWFKSKFGPKLSIKVCDGLFSVPEGCTFTIEGVSFTGCKGVPDGSIEWFCSCGHATKEQHLASQTRKC